MYDALTFMKCFVLKPFIAVSSLISINYSSFTGNITD